MRVLVIGRDAICGCAGRLKWEPEEDYFDIGNELYACNFERLSTFLVDLL